jgi:hypothetical protein
VTLQTEYPFTLPKGYVDESGTLHRDGVMRLATARDEIAPLRDLKVQDNEAYLTVVILSRVVTKLGSISPLNTGVIEGLFASDLAYLQDLYGIINFGDPSVLQAAGGEEDPLVEEEQEEEPSNAKGSASGRRRGAAVEEVAKKG